MKILTASFLALALATASGVATAQTVVPAPFDTRVGGQYDGRDDYYGDRRGSSNGRAVASVVGSVLGALVGSQVGDGSGRIATSAIGSAVGAIAGQQVYENAQRQRNVGRVTVCDPLPGDYGNYRTGASGQYDVTYEYGGRRHTTRTHYHPGDRIRVRVSAE